MALRLYKPGQGYWVRVLTATVLGIVTLLGSVWLWKQLETVSLPIREWEFTVRGNGTATPGAPASLDIPAEGATAATPIATGVVSGMDQSGNSARVRVHEIQTQPNREISAATVLTVGAPGATWAAPIIGSRGVPIFDKLYLQAAGVGAFMLASTLFAFWMVGVKTSTSEFLIATDGEMKKVNWSTRKDIIGSTQVVVLWCVLLASGLFAVDTIFAKFFQIIGVLER